MLNSIAMIGVEPMLIILLVVLVLFGGTKIPQLMRGVGQGYGELRKGIEEGQRQIINSARIEDEKKPEPPAPSTEKDKDEKGKETTPIG
jgi:sec-independent protein translocase protein TatA